MSSPKHLWSGDWERESASAAADRANLPVPAPAEPAPVAPPSPAPPSGLRRALAAVRALGARLGDLRLPRLRPRQRRAALLVALAALVIAGGAVALNSSGAGSGPVAVNASTPWLGLQMASLPVNRVLVAGVTPGSPADRAGVGVGDLILGVNGKPVSSPGDVDAALAGLRAGDRVKLQIGRGPLTFTVPAKLTARPASYP
jgi:membrane-associated protease RseP (regulator of RpoE activity)